MAQIQHTCTGCIPIDATIIDVYVQMLGTKQMAEQAAADAERAAQHAIGKSPYIGENGDWFEWDDAQAAFVDTGVQAQSSIAVDDHLDESSTNPTQNKVVTEAINGKYTKPSGGIPSSDLSTAVQTSLGKADTAYQKPGSGIPKTDFASGVQTSLKRADESYVREYNTTTPNGMGYKVLDKDDTLAEQVTDTNTIYEIRYPFDLNSASFTIPSGCVLKFNGGKLSNGTLTGQGTNIIAEAVEIFDSITIAGTWNVEKIMSVWFAKDKYTIGNLLLMNNASINTEIIIDGNYDAYVPNAGTDGLAVVGNTTLRIAGTITKEATSVSANSAVFSLAGENIFVIGGVIDGNKSTFGTANEYGHGFDINSAKNIRIVGVKIKDCRGDGVYVGGATTNTGISFECCEIVGARRNGIAIINGKFVTIKDTYIHDVKGTSPKCAIDLEPNSDSQVVENITINNCTIEDCGSYLNIIGRANSKIKNVVANNTNVTLTAFTSCVTINYSEFIVFNNCLFNLSGRTSTYCFTSSNLSGRWDFNHCFIKDASTSGYLLNTPGNFTNTNIESGATIQNAFYARFIRCNVTCSKDFSEKGSTAGGVIDTCTITATNITISGTSSSRAKNYVIRNSTITLNATYYPITANYIDNVRIYNNILNLTGTRNLINFAYATDVFVNDNTITIGSNNNAIAFDSNSSGCEASANIFKAASGVTWTSMRYSGINKDTTATNRAGVPYYSETSFKMVVYNGTSVVNVDGTTL